MDHSKVVEHMAMAEATGVPGEQKKAIVMNILIGSGLIKSEPEKVAAGLAIALALFLQAQASSKHIRITVAACPVIPVTAAGNPPV